MLRKTLLEKRKLLNNASNDFLDAIHSTEKAIFSKVVQLIKSLDTEGGKLVQSDSNSSLVARLNGAIWKILANSTIGKKTSEFTGNFDKIDELNDKFYAALLQLDTVTVNSATAKKLVVDEITSALTTKPQLDANYRKQIRKVLFDAITLGQSISETTDQLRNLIKGTDTRDGLLTRYARQITNDALRAYDGRRNIEVQKKYKLDGFRYVGSLIDDSRDNCGELVNGSGRFKDIALGRGMYRVEDIPRIVELAKGRKGWNDSTTASTFALFRGGYNCRHEIIFIRLTDARMKALEL